MKQKKQKVRNYKVEYQRRIKSAMKRGYSRNQAAGHPNKNKGEAGILEKQRTALLVATSPCVGCTCSGTPEACSKLDGWLVR